ncbi:MAG TPA: formate dehydrogenase accessory protein FdhE, partial [bacterium]|nr:formate dehydrogenase accessory protein FdhE [bacterium]
FDKSGPFPKAFIQNFISEDSDYFHQLSKDTEIEFNILIYIARTISLPFLKEYAELFKQQLTQVNSIWFRPFCPLCGNMPAMAKLEKEVGQRYLWCAVCHQDWQFSRLQCPHCANEDQNSVRYFYDENDSQYRVYVCEKCKHYIKTVDERTMAENQQASMFLEDIITHYLDELALKEGYLSMLWWVLSHS